MPRRVYLLPKELVQHSRFHTAYAGDGPVVGQGQIATIHSLTFINGIAENVDEGLYQRFHDLGICDVNPPSWPDEER